VKAAYLTEVIGPDGLKFGDIQAPSPKEGEVLVQVHAAALTPTEFSWFPTFKTRDGAPRPFPIILGHEFSGVVAAIGNGANGLKPGDEVYGLNDWFTNGAQAEYCIAPVDAFAPKPAVLDHITAAAAPISLLTAWQGLFERAALKPGERVLIHGGAGGVGLFAVQLAHWRRAHVIATASARNSDFVRGLGANEVIDYKSTPFEKVVRDIDVVFDTVGGETLERTWSVVGANGRLVTIAVQSEDATKRARDAFFIVEPNRTQLTEVTPLLNAGTIRVFVDAVFPLAKAREGYARAQQSAKRGKVVLQIGGET
jgi:NADPH:quinone reductase-like Zn-dependent oxidoreductase